MRWGLWALLAAGTPAFAGDAFITYTARAVNPSGDALEGTHSVRVTLYSDAAGTTDVWRKTWPTATFDDGRFDLDLTGDDDTSPTPRTLDDALAGSALYVGIAIDGTVDLTPIQRLGSTVGSGLPSGCVAGALPYWSGGAWTCTTGGNVLQEVSTTSGPKTVSGWPGGSVSSSAGTEIMAVTITPTHVGSTLEVQAIGAVRENGNSSNRTGMGLFRNSETTAIAVAHNNGAFSPYSHGNSSQGSVSHHETLRWTGLSTSTAPVTFRVRIGAEAGSDLACNPGTCTLVVKERL